MSKVFTVWTVSTVPTVYKSAALRPSLMVFSNSQLDKSSERLDSFCKTGPAGCWRFQCNSISSSCIYRVVFADNQAVDKTGRFSSVMILSLKSHHHHTNYSFILCLNALLIPEFLTVQKSFQMSTYSDTSIFDGFVDLAPAPVEDPAPVYRTVRLEHCSNLARKRTWVFRFIPFLGQCVWLLD